MDTCTCNVQCTYDCMYKLNWIYNSALDLLHFRVFCRFRLYAAAPDLNTEGENSMIICTVHVQVLGLCIIIHVVLSVLLYVLYLVYYYTCCT